MTGKKKNGYRSPWRPRYRDLLPLLHPTSIKASLEGTALIARHEHYTMRIEVVCRLKTAEVRKRPGISCSGAGNQ